MKVCKREEVTEAVEESYEFLEAGQLAYLKGYEGDPAHLRFIVEVQSYRYAVDMNGQCCASRPDFLTTERYTVVEGCVMVEGED